MGGYSPGTGLGEESMIMYIGAALFFIGGIGWLSSMFEMQVTLRALISPFVVFFAAGVFLGGFMQKLWGG